MATPREDKGFGEDWQPSEYWASTGGSAAGSTWFDSWAAPAEKPQPTKSKGVARSAERFGTAAVGLPVTIGGSAAPRPADVNPDDPDAAHRHRLRDPVNRFSGFSAPPVDLPSKGLSPRQKAAPQVAPDPVPAPSGSTSPACEKVEQPTPVVEKPASPTRTTSGKRDREEMLHTNAGADEGCDADDVERLREFAGYDKQVHAARELISLPILHSELFHAVGTGPPGGVLIVGPSGVGKTKLVHLAAAAAGAELVVLNGGDVVSEGSNSSEDLKTIFKRAREQAPCVLFLDEVDALAPKTTAATGTKGNAGGARMVSQLLTLLDESMRWRDADRVIIVAATNRPHSVDPALRRAGRLDNEIALGLPDEKARVEILTNFVSGMALSSDVDVEALAACTHGYTGADLAGVCDAAGTTCLREFLAETGVADFSDPSNVPLPMLSDAKEGLPEGSTPSVLHRHFLQAVDELGPSGMREMRVECPNVSWDAVGGLEATKSKLQRAIVWPLTHPNRFRHFGAAASRGVVLHGPPGCGKTLLAKAVATECKANFITVQSTDLLTSYVGESEANVREVFEKARSVRPCVIFIDEVDAIATTRAGGASESSSGGATDGVVSALLSELDTISNMAGVVVIGATNRLDKIDPALLRPGRLGTLCFVALPDQQQRLAVLNACVRKAPQEPGLEDALRMIADATDGLSGADLNAICERAVQIAVREAIQMQMELASADAEVSSTPSPLSKRHLEIAMQSSRRSVSAADAEWYSAVAEAASAGKPLPTRIAPAAEHIGADDDDDDLESLQERLRLLVEEVKDASRWERSWATARRNTDACLATSGDDISGPLKDAWMTHVADP
jgi:transitional endoplasmic reticulum ATPase